MTGGLYENTRRQFSSNEDFTKKISHSVFVTNFPDYVNSRDLWNKCSVYGTVIDVFIPNKKSKAGKRFAFVRFIKVFNLDRLVKNLCTIWIGSYHLFANQVRGNSVGPTWIFVVICSSLVLDERCLWKGFSLIGATGRGSPFDSITITIPSRGRGIRECYIVLSWRLVGYEVNPDFVSDENEDDEVLKFEDSYELPLTDKELNKEFSPTISAKVMNKSQVESIRLFRLTLLGNGNNKGDLFWMLDEIIRVGSAMGNEDYGFRTRRAKADGANEGDETFEILSSEESFKDHDEAHRVADLDVRVLNDEIRLAVWDCGVNKSPGPDGFTFEFFRNIGRVNGPDYCEASFEHFFKRAFAIGFAVGGSLDFQLCISSAEWTSVLSIRSSGSVKVFGRSLLRLLVV
ncbi:RNA-directed DNA polymerase, eukaryota, nucleotide-binding alpha-beta plait domain protein [Tanacetum coccineum]